MAYKPVHIITNDDLFYVKVWHTHGFENGFERGVEDYTEEEGLHFHYHIHWPITDNYSLSPTRPGAVGSWRREGLCDYCRYKQHNYPCPACGIYYRFIWLQTEEHHQNCHNYIEGKIAANPHLDIEWEPGNDNEDLVSEEESDEEGGEAGHIQPNA